MDAVGVGEAQEEIVARAVAPRSPENGSLLAAQVISPGQQVGTSGNAVSDMIDILLALHENQRVMIAIAAQPNAFAQQPIRDIEAQGLCVEFHHLLQVHATQGKMLQRLGTQTNSAALASGRKVQEIFGRHRDLNAIAIGIAKPERITHFGIAIALSQLKSYTGLIEASSQGREFRVCSNRKRNMEQPR